MKRILATMLSIAMVFSQINPVLAGNRDSIELVGEENCVEEVGGSIEPPVDTISIDEYVTLASDTSMTEISVNTACPGKLESISDENWYQFAIPQAGNISLTFTHDYLESVSTYWRAYLYDSEMRELAAYSFAGNKTTYTQGKIGLSAGTYYLKINALLYSDKDYKIKINYVSSTEWEQEFNDKYEAANPVQVNTSYSGSMRDNDDVDWYQFTTSNAGYVYLEFNHDYLESVSTYWKAYLYDSEMRELASYSFAGNKTAYAQGKIGLPAGIYYLKISDLLYSDKDYSIKMNYASSAEWEQEFNDEYDTANSIQINTGCSGSIRDNDDVDWYQLTVPSDGKQVLNFNHEYVDSNSTYWKLYLYDSRMEKLYDFSYDGRTTELNNDLSLSAGRYYIKITDLLYSDATYHFQLTSQSHVHEYKTVVTQATTTTDGKIEKRCSCGDVELVSVIYHPESVSLSTPLIYNGKVRTPPVTVTGSDGENIPSSNYTVSYEKGCKDVGQYKVTVKLKGNYKGTLTKTFTILPKGTSLDKLTAKANGFTVTWKKQTIQTTGYQIQCSRNNGFTDSSIKTTKKNSVVSANCSNLRSGTKYFVRIRTYKNVSGKAYYSAWSAVKTIVTKTDGSSIKLNKTAATLYLSGNKTIQLKTKVQGKSKTVTWKSSNSKVAKVGPKGKVTAKAVGTAVITAKANGKTATCTVEVKAFDPYEISNYFDRSIRDFAKYAGLVEYTAPQNIGIFYKVNDEDAKNGYMSVSCGLGDGEKAGAWSITGMTNDKFSVYGLKIGMEVEQADTILKKNGYETAGSWINSEENGWYVYKSDEHTIRIIAPNHVVEEMSVTNTSIQNESGDQSIVSLKSGETYSFDLNQDGRAEEVKLVYKDYGYDYYHGGSGEPKKGSAELYINGESVWQHTSTSVLENIRVLVADTLKADDQMELFILQGLLSDDNSEEYEWASEGWLADIKHIDYYQYKNGSIVKRQDLRTMLEARFDELSEVHAYSGNDYLFTDGDGKLGVKECLNLGALDFIHVHDYIVFKDGEFISFEANACPVVDNSRDRDEEDGWDFISEEIISVPETVYGSQISFTLKEGEKVNAEEIYRSDEGALYIKISNSNGKAGYILLDKFHAVPDLTYHA